MDTRNGGISPPSGDARGLASQTVDSDQPRAQRTKTVEQRIDIEAVMNLARECSTRDRIVPKNAKANPPSTALTEAS